MEYRPFQFISDSDGQSIQGYVWPAVEEPKIVTVIAHGMAEHALRYERFANALNKAGSEVWAIDHRGHGRSAGPKGLGDFGKAGWQGIVQDLRQAIEQARQAHPSLPLILFSHSMGSMAAQNLIIDSSTLIDALILSGSSTFSPPGPTPNTNEEEGAHRLSLDVNAAFEPARTPYDWLSRDESEVDKYINDPLCGFDAMVEQQDSISTLIEPISKSDAFKDIRADLPILLVAGDKDPINNNLKGLHLLEKRLRASGVTRIDSLYYTDGRHEMLNEINRDEVTRQIIDWIKSLS